MNKTLWKDIRRLIRSTKGRFFSLTTIVLIGVSFFVGISSVSTIMGYSVDTYDDELNLKDITIYSNYGFDEEDIEAISKLDHVQTVEGAHFVDVLGTCEETTYVTRVHSYDLNNKINEFKLVDGRMPENKNEVLAENGTDMISGFTIGSKVKLSRPDNDLDDFLSVDEVTVVGTIDTPVYLNETKENSTLSNQVLRTYLYIPAEAFSEDYYTEVNVLVEDASEMDSFSDKYASYTEEVKDEIEAFSSSQAEVRKDSVLAEAMEKYNDGLQEYNDGKKEFDEKISDAEKEIADNEQKILDAEQEIKDGYQKLQDAEDEVTRGEIDGANQIHGARNKISEGTNTLNESKEEFKKQKEELNKTIEQIDSGITQLNQGIELLNNYIQVRDNLTTLNTTIEGLSSTELTTLIVGLKTMPDATPLEAIPSEEMKIGINALIESLKQINTQLNPEQEFVAPTTIKELLNLYESTITALTAQQTQLEAIKVQLDAALVQAQIEEGEVDAKLVEYQTQLESLKSSKQQIEDGIASGEEKLAAAEQELVKAYEQTVNASVELDEKIADARKEIAENRQKLVDSEAELKDAKQKIADAKEELETSRVDGEQELVDAKAELDKAYQDIQDLDDAKWTVLDRTSHYASATYKGTIEQMQAIANIFPVFFLLVAALVCLTTMTRMVDEQRGQIGVMRALGYSEFQCASKYLVYAALATIIGEILGSVFGMMIFPPIIYTLWRMMYILPELKFEVPWGLVLSSSAIFLVVMELTTYNACRKDTKEVPAQLLRPKAPKLGKSTFIEKIGFIWKHLSFTWKITVRNLIRYKKRFFMTVFGVAGCTALLVTGWGVRDSVKAMVDIQFDDIIYYDGLVSVGDEVSVSEFNSLVQDIKSRSDVKKAVSITDYNAVLSNDKDEETVYVYAFEQISDLDGLLNLRTRTNHTKIELTDDGVVLSEKLAENLGLKVGDLITLESKDGVKKEVTVSGICEMYIQHYVFMTQAYYNKVFDTKVSSNTVCVEINGDDDVSLAFQKDIVNHDYVNSITFNESVLNNFRTMANSLDLVVWVLLIASMSLAFVVLGNLTNVNISERQREIATLKVLGFRKNEVQNYIYKENNVLTFIGAIVGIPVGTFLHHYIMKQVEMDYIMFGRSVQPLSYLYSVMFTIVFGHLVNFFMRKKLKNIDMIESLKSVE